MEWGAYQLRSTKASVCVCVCVCVCESAGVANWSQTPARTNFGTGSRGQEWVLASQISPYLGLGILLWKMGMGEMVVILSFWAPSRLCCCMRSQMGVSVVPRLAACLVTSLPPSLGVPPCHTVWSHLLQHWSTVMGFLSEKLENNSQKKLMKNILFSPHLVIYEYIVIVEKNHKTSEDF
jgi:hypothetical protein